MYVSDNHDHIATDNCPFRVSDSAPVEVPVSADTYVRDGEHANTVFGAVPRAHLIAAPQRATVARHRLTLRPACLGISFAAPYMTGAEQALVSKRPEADKVGKGFSRIVLLRFDMPQGLPAWSKCGARRRQQEEPSYSGQFLKCVLLINALDVDRRITSNTRY